jgi:hypothetical protein
MKLLYLYIGLQALLCDITSKPSKAYISLLFVDFASSVAYNLFLSLYVLNPKSEHSFSG